ncbi:glycosyltransferase family 39 protein [Candidatus Roizmanbacteria bacterium]|nr:glycosyltransferase family 39 protein [Candidatus Roizmanbacteria bacterium]
MYKIAILLVLAFLVRIVGINWDQGFHLHPDERAIILVSENIRFFSNLNPHFFNYGSLPIYLLKGATQIFAAFFPSSMTEYFRMLYVGRVLSVVFDIATVYLLYQIAVLVFKDEKLALLSSFFYAIAFFPIQNAHFYIVDVPLTFFITLCMYLLLLYIKKPSMKLVVFMGATLAAAVATKFTAIILLLPAIFVLVARRTSTTQQYNHTTIRPSNHFIVGLLLFPFSFFLFTFLFMPYAFLDYQKFLADISLQIKLNNNPYAFPYTLQYVATTPYLYYLKNIFLWGAGPIISILSVVGFVVILSPMFHRTKDLDEATSDVAKSKKNANARFFGLRPQNDEWWLPSSLVMFYGWYFLVVGQSAAKFMRYMLPLYPFFAMLAGYGFYKLYNVTGPAATFPPASAPPTNVGVRAVGSPSSRVTRHIVFAILVTAVFWTFAFMNIYSQKHTRVAASEWMVKNIPSGSTLAVEHWDDRLPLFGQERYRFEELPLYDLPDDRNKWAKLNEKFGRSDYLIIASNRLYRPLQKLSDCKRYKVCYPETSGYYKRLFEGTLGFSKVAEFTSYPSLKIGSWKLKIPDDTADESFTVYDHPKVLIFRKFTSKTM